MFLPSLNL